MGLAHPKFNKETFFKNYSYKRTVEDPIFGILFVFISNDGAHSVYLQQVDKIIDVHTDTIAQLKRDYDYHHPNLLHSFNLLEFADPAEAQAYGMDQVEDSLGTECLLIFETFNEDLKAKI